MKRRSARPFVVEVKSARSSRSPLTDAFTRTRSSTSLWQGVSISDEVPPSKPQQKPGPAANVEPPKAEAQLVRRVLPALVPLYVPSEPEPQNGAEETATRPASPVRTTRKPRSRSAAIEGVRSFVQPATAEWPSPLMAVDEPSVVQPLQASSAPPTPLRTDRRECGQRHPELRRGERWKRRLPRACW
jgi:hypothetical protein